MRYHLAQLTVVKVPFPTEQTTDRPPGHPLSAPLIKRTVRTSVITQLMFTESKAIGSIPKERS